ncbi:MAG: hypothetical protein Q7T60_16975 [Sphingopyxis sp.]|nr:hypothetical protein [Sphingopyxis sp.]
MSEHGEFIAEMMQADLKMQILMQELKEMRARQERYDQRRRKARALGYRSSRPA